MREAAALNPSPTFDHVLAFLEVPLCRAPLIVNRHHPLGWPGQVGDDEADTGIWFAGMPFHLGHHAPLPVPVCNLIAEAGVMAPHMVRRTANRSSEQMADVFLKYMILWWADRVRETPRRDRRDRERALIIPTLFLPRIRGRRLRLQRSREGSFAALGRGPGRR